MSAARIFPHAVIVADVQRCEFSDVAITSCTVAESLSEKDLKGHVTLMK